MNKNKNISIILLGAFCFVAYLALCFYFYISDDFYFVFRAKDLFSKMYSFVGFDWSVVGSYYFSLSIVFGVF